MKQSDKKLEKLILAERLRQKRTVNLIASENLAPKGVLNFLGSEFTNKYAEGYPSRRYYPGTKFYDELETLTQARARQAFGLKENWHANVQAYSGAIANLAIYLAALKPGDKILSLSLPSGGHLSHGASASFTGKLFHVKHYEVNDKYRLNYADLEKIARKERPKMIVSGASAYPFVIDFKKIGAIAKKVGALHLADISHYAGLIAGGVYSSPFPYADFVMSTTHKSLMGPRAALIFVNSASALVKKNNLVTTLDKAVFPGLQGGPHMNTIVAIAYGLGLVAQPGFKKYASQVLKNSRTLAAELAKNGFKILGGGTDSHIVLADVSSLGLNGKEAEELLEKNGILANRNMVAGDSSPQKPSALRFGTYWITSLGWKEKEVQKLAQKISKILIPPSF